MIQTVAAVPMPSITSFKMQILDIAAAHFPAAGHCILLHITFMASIYFLPQRHFQHNLESLRYSTRTKPCILHLFTSIVADDTFL